MGRFPRSPRTGELQVKAMTDVPWDAPRMLLGIRDASHGNYFASTRASPTGDGIRWGLHGWRSSLWSVDPASVTTTLATDESGMAAAWVRRYGGPAGTGFVELYGGWYGGFTDDRNYQPLDLAAVQAVAECLPR